MKTSAQGLTGVRTPASVLYMTTIRTETGTYLGHCTGGCGTVKTAAKFVKHSCGAWVTGYQPIKSRITEHQCGPRCTSALGPVCDCTCGGKAHGEDHRS